MTVQFSGETAWDAIINHNSLDLEEKQEFLGFVEASGASQHSPTVELEALFQAWQAEVV